MKVTNEAQRERERCVRVCRRRAELWHKTSVARTGAVAAREEARARANEAPPTPAPPSGASALTPTPMKPGEPRGLQMTELLPFASVEGAIKVSPLGLVFTVTWAPETG